MVHCPMVVPDTCPIFFVTLRSEYIYDIDKELNVFRV